ncbi:hypothetical protein PR048_014469 [Dryococelus australis]|uniref:DNA helicase Pif1-like 2B domain-containing protein n=1 Tax=Dryococelus australis TaxID=614101 RepID=A0ABQ9HEB0_9NEOP|nr:hypothetical protein PR048_014469 [Dryococelus australis]
MIHKALGRSVLSNSDKLAETGRDHLGSSPRIGGAPVMEGILVVQFRFWTSSAQVSFCRLGNGSRPSRSLAWSCHLMQRLWNMQGHSWQTVQYMPLLDQSVWSHHRCLSRQFRQRLSLDVHLKDTIALEHNQRKSPRNDTVNEINNLIIQRVPGHVKTYKSIDTFTNVDDVVHFQDFLNSLNPSGLPPQELSLKVGTPIMLLRNISPPNMYNGTRLLIKDLKENLIVATILTGPAAGQLANIPRIPMIPTDLPISFKWLQFPVKTLFAITINKSQSQTLSLVGIDLQKERGRHPHGRNFITHRAIDTAERKKLVGRDAAREQHPVADVTAAQASWRGGKYVISLPAGRSETALRRSRRPANLSKVGGHSPVCRLFLACMLERHKRSRPLSQHKSSTLHKEFKEDVPTDITSNPQFLHILLTPAPDQEVQFNSRKLLAKPCR